MEIVPKFSANENQCSKNRTNPQKTARIREDFPKNIIGQKFSGRAKSMDRPYGSGRRFSDNSDNFG